MQSPPCLFWRGEPLQLTLAIRVEEDHVVPFGTTAPIAVGRSRDEDLLADRDIEHPRNTGRNFVLGPFAVFGGAPSHWSWYSMRSSESVAGVGDAPGLIGLDAILLDMAPGQSRTAEHDREA